METMKSSGFYGLNLTPDSCLTDLYNPSLSTLASCSNNPWPVQYVTAENFTFTAYEYATYAQQDPSTGYIIPEYQGYFSSASEPNIKFMHVMVTYTVNNLAKESDLTDFLSNKNVPMAGSTISGTVTLSSGGAPAQATSPMVYLNNQPMANVSASGAFTIYNVQPGPCYLSASAQAAVTNYFVGDYAGNPLNVSNTAQTYSGITITCVAVNPATITGFATYSSTALPIAKQTPAAGVFALSNDGLSSVATTTITVNQNFTITSVYAGAGGQNVTVNLGDPPNSGVATPVVVAVSPGVATNIGSVQLYVNSSSTGTLTVNVKNFTTGAAISGATVTLTNILNTYTASTNALGVASFINIVPGAYSFAVSDPGYMIQGSPPPTINIVQGPNTAQNIQLVPVESISGNVYDASNNPIANIPVKVINNYGSGSSLGSANSNASGAYTINNVPLGTGYEITAELSSTSYTWSNPVSGLSPPITVSNGVPVTGQNLTFALAYKSITGTVSMSGVPVTDGAIIIALPSSNTQTPDTFDMAESSYFLQAQTTYVRQKYPSYGAIVTSSGTYSIAVPATGTYNIYAYYSSHTAKPMQTPTYQRYYISATGVNPGTSQNISGSWTSY